MLNEKFLDPLRRNSIMAISAIKSHFRVITQASPVISAESFEKINAYRESVYRGPDYVEGVNSFIEKRAPEYIGKASDHDKKEF